MFDAACGNNPSASGGVGGKVTAGTVGAAVVGVGAAVVGVGAAVVGAAVVGVGAAVVGVGAAVVGGSVVDGSGMTLMRACAAPATTEVIRIYSSP